MGALTHNGEVLQSLPANASQINFNKTGTNLNSTQTEAAIKEVNTKVNTNTEDITQLKSGLTNQTVLIKTINGTTTISGALSTDLDQQYYTILGARSLNTNMFGFNRGDAYLTVFEVVNGVWGLAAEKSASFEVYYIKRPTS